MAVRLSFGLHVVSMDETIDDVAAPHAAPRKRPSRRPTEPCAERSKPERAVCTSCAFTRAVAAALEASGRASRDGLARRTQYWVVHVHEEVAVVPKDRVAVPAALRARATLAAVAPPRAPARRHKVTARAAARAGVHRAAARMVAARRSFAASALLVERARVRGPGRGPPRVMAWRWLGRRAQREQRGRRAERRQRPQRGLA